MELMGVLIFGIVGVVFTLAVQTFFLMWGAKIAGIQGRNFGKALVTVVIGGIASFLFSLGLSIVPGFGTVIGLFGGFLVTALIMMVIYKTDFGKALAATVIAWVLGIIVIGGLAALFFFVFGGMALLAA